MTDLVSSSFVIARGVKPILDFTFQQVDDDEELYVKALRLLDELCYLCYFSILFQDHYEAFVISNERNVRTVPLIYYQLSEQLE